MGVSGIVWQLDNTVIDASGSWDRLGVDQLLIQWSMVDGVNYLTGDRGKIPDWHRVSEAPWARKTILGLAGNFSERTARQHVIELAEASLRLAKYGTPLNITGYYFPVEADPTWKDAQILLPRALDMLPRPIWISVYDSSNIGATEFAAWVATWLPDDAGIFFQDGVGVEARSPKVARLYMDALAKEFGENRIKVIVEAFRPAANGSFRPAELTEILPQLLAMQGFDIFLFDGPHYVSQKMIDGIVEYSRGKES